MILCCALGGALLAPCAPQRQVPPAAPGAPVAPISPISPISKEEATPILITAVGDIMMAARAEEYLQEKGLDYSYPFDKVRIVLREGDVGVGNLEGPVTLNGERVTDKTFTFKMRPEALDGIAGAGVTLVTLANNHVLDYGAMGLENTIRALVSHGMFFAGAGMTLKEARAPASLTVRGLRITMLAYSVTFPESFYAGEDRPGTAYPFEEILDQDVPSAGRTSDLLIVSFHWGQELMESPKDYQRDLAHRAIDRGAKLVLGHHPHAVQGIEAYHGGLIFYSLGNFVFGSYSEKVRDSIIARVFFSPGMPITAEVVPIDVYNKEVLFQPTPLAGERAHTVLEHLEEISRPWGTRIDIRNDRGTIVSGKE